MGRWHKNGQSALYLSGSPEGCRVALKVYLNPNDPPRGIFPLDVTNAKIADLRSSGSRRAFSASLQDIHAFWADLAKAGQSSPTWDIGDQARNLGLDGLLTPSRSRPDLTHLTLFKWNEPQSAGIVQAGKPLLF